MIDKCIVVEKVSREIIYFIDNRKKKLKSSAHETMSINPLLLPIIYDLHGFKDFNELSKYLVSAHLMVGHSTGFGKLIDEKILPNVFGTIKLTKELRKKNPPLSNSCFDEIDHLIPKGDQKYSLLSLKAGRWTIQLTMAVQLNKSFNEILSSYSEMFEEITVGVFYGKEDSLTDKYDILRGINRGANHDVFDLTDRVFVKSGREFWEWVNGGEKNTQAWVLEGILQGIRKSNSSMEFSSFLENFNESVKNKYNDYVQQDGGIDWPELLKNISG